jgi:hypothetical protein
MFAKGSSFSLVVVAALLVGCASSGGNTVLRARPGVTLIISPFKVEGSAVVATKDPYTVEDAFIDRLLVMEPRHNTAEWNARIADIDEQCQSGRLWFGIDRQLHCELLHEKLVERRSLSPIGQHYRFTLEDADIDELRESLIARLRKSEAFVKVTDWRPGQVPANAWMMELTLRRRGMGMTATRFTCFIEGHVSILDKEGVRREANVSAMGTSWIPHPAKTEAEGKLIDSVLETLNQTP